MMTCAQRTHGVHTRAKKNRAQDLLRLVMEMRHLVPLRPLSLLPSHSETGLDNGDFIGDGPALHLAFCDGGFSL